MKKLLIIICFIFTGLILFLNCIVVFKNSIFLYWVPFVITVAIIYLMTRYLKIHPVFFMIILFIAAFTLKVFVALYYNIPPDSDFEKFYNAAVQAANGDFSFSIDKYFSLWAYQTGIVSYYAILIKLFGNGLVALKIANCLFIAGTNVILYLISRIHVSEKYARFIAILYLVYPEPYFLASVLTNQHIANFLMLSGIYIFIRQNKLSTWPVVLSAFFIALGNAMRPQGIIVIIGITGCLLLKLLDCIRDKKQFVQITLSLAGVLVIYMSVSFGLSSGIKAFGLNNNGLNNTFPLYKFVIGLNHETNGFYSQSDAINLMSVNDLEKRDEKAIQLIKQRLTEWPDFFRFFIRKQNYMWAKPDDSIAWGFGYYENTGVNILGHNVKYPLFKLIIQDVEKCFYLFILVMAISGLVTGYQNQVNSKGFYVILIIILANFGIYSLIEVQNRYRDFQIIFMFSVAAVGVEALAKSFHSRMKEIRDMNINGM